MVYSKGKIKPVICSDNQNLNAASDGDILVCADLNLF